MKLEVRGNRNYAAVVVRVKTLLPLENSDNLVGIPLMGYQAIVGKGDFEVGQLGIVFPAECQLSDEYVKMNSLYRHAELNSAPDHKGYLEDNRRIKAIKLRGNRSDALFMPVSSLFVFGMVGEPGVAGSPTMLLKEGDEFDTVDGQEVCRKYVLPIRGNGAHNQQRKTTVSRVDPKLFPEMFDMSSYFREVDNLDQNAYVVVTQKLHGTSIRIGNVPVTQPETLWDRIRKNLFFQKVTPRMAFDMVYGSRKVIKDSNNPNQQHYYDTDIWTEEGKKLDGLIPEGFVVYGELVGFTSTGAPIQTHYTYGQAPNTCRLYVYRVAFVNNAGMGADLSFDAMKEFCAVIGVDSVRELWRGKLVDFQPELFMDITYGAVSEMPIEAIHCFPDYGNAVLTSPDSLCDEGVVMRFEGMTPRMVKAKSPLFLGHETAMLDAEAVDIESEESVDDTDSN